MAGTVAAARADNKCPSLMLRFAVAIGAICSARALTRRFG